MRRPVSFPAFKDLSSQQQIHGLCQPFLYDSPGRFVCIAEKPPAILEAVAVIFLVLYNAVERYEFTRG